MSNGELPSERKEAEDVFEGILYKRAFSRALLRCVEPGDGIKILEKIHEGICGAHLEGRAIALTALKIGYYWPTLKEGATDLVRKCDKCQKFSKIPELP